MSVFLLFVLFWSKLFIHNSFVLLLLEVEKRRIVNTHNLYCFIEQMLANGDHVQVSGTGSKQNSEIAVDEEQIPDLVE